MATERTPIPRAVRAARGAVTGDGLAVLSTVHVGQSSVLLRAADDRLVPVTSASHGLVPAGMCLPSERDFRALAEHAGHMGTVDLRAWDAVLPAVGIDLSVQPCHIDRAATDALAAAALLDPPSGGARPCPAPPDGVPLQPALRGAAVWEGSMDPNPVRRRAEALARAASSGDAAAVSVLLVELVGVGPGSTPSGDDVVVGVLAGLVLGGRGSRPAAELVRAALPGLLHRTTTISRHDLTAAIHGQFAERVHVLLAAVADPLRVPAAVGVARTWGATSGLDLAAGVAAGARAATAASRSPLPQTPTLRRSA